MALSPLHSAEWLQYTSTPSLKQQPHKWGAKLHISSASLTWTVAGTGTAKMLRLPPGKVRIFSDLSRIVCPQGTSSATLSIGYATYVNEAGTTVAASAAALASVLAIGTAAVDAVFALPAIGYLDLDSQNGVDIEAVIATANSPASGEMFLAIAYTRVG